MLEIEVQATARLPRACRPRAGSAGVRTSQMPSTFGGLNSMW